MKNSKNALDDTQYELKQRDRRILFAPTLTAVMGFLHECPGFGLAFLQQHDGSFVHNPAVNIYFVVDWCLGSVYTSIADTEAAWMQYGWGGNIHAKVGSYWSAMEASLDPP
ncbi:hypothetical protein B0H14DRAFT_3422890 [Mycena olivaceomarginata]|nr:hypothetical protein B0H14DRAFT_3422890 [Mycena olivaceomarginata]